MAGDKYVANWAKAAQGYIGNVCTFSTQRRFIQKTFPVGSIGRCFFDMASFDRKHQLFKDENGEWFFVGRTRPKVFVTDSDAEFENEYDSEEDEEEECHSNVKKQKGHKIAPAKERQVSLKISTDRRKKRPRIKSKPTGFLCINKLMNRVIGKVLTKARARDKSRKWGSENRQRQNETVKRWKTNNRDKHLAMTRSYNQSHLQQSLAYQRKRRLTDPKFAIKCRMRARLSDAIKKGRGSKTDKTYNLIGCSPSELMDHFVKQLPDFDTSRHHIDHIFAFDLFDLRNKGNLRRVMNWSNTQPLTQTENSQKSCKLPTKAMAAKVKPECWPPGITMDMLPDIYPGWATPLRMHVDGNEVASSSSSGAGSSEDHAMMEEEDDDSEDESGDSDDSDDSNDSDDDSN